MGEGAGSGHPLKDHKNTGFLSNMSPDPLKNHQAAKEASNFGPLCAYSETPYEWHYADGPLMACF